MGLFKLEETKKVDLDVCYELLAKLAYNDACLIINEILPKLENLDEGISINLEDLSLIESDILINGKKYLTTKLSERDFYESINHLSYYKRAFTDNLISNGAINSSEYGGVKFDYEYNLTNAVYSVQEYDSKSNTNTLYRISINIPDELISSGIIKPGMKSLLYMGFSLALFGVSINIFSDRFIEAISYPIIYKTAEKSVNSGSEAIHNLIDINDTTKSAFSLLCREATKSNSKFVYTAEVKYNNIIKSAILKSSRELILEIKSYYKQ